jgi:hypothetical protein
MYEEGIPQIRIYPGGAIQYTHNAGQSIDRMRPNELHILNEFSILIFRDRTN